MSTEERHLLQPTYQTILIQALSDVVFRMNNNDIFGAYNALETLYILLPKDCATDVEQTHDNIINQILKMENQNRSIDIALRQMNLTNWKRQYLHRCNATLLKAFKNSLDKYNYLDIAKGRPATKAVSMGDIQKTIDIARHQTGE